MRLSDALRLVPGCTAAFIGAGGKSSSLKRLAAEGRFPITVLATTTRIFRHQSSFAAEHHVLVDESQVPLILKRLEQVPSLFLTGESTPDQRKWTGVDPELLGPVHAAVTSLGGIMAIEADGARGGSLKAPAGFEPVLPDFVDVLVPIAGMDVLGVGLDSPLVHRAERIEKITGSIDKVTPEVVASVLASPEGGMKLIPDHAAARVLLNKVENDEAAEQGRRIAGLLLQNERVDAVMLTSLAGEVPVREVLGRTAGIVLSAGEGQRFGGSKQLQSWNGEVFVHRTARIALEAGFSPVIVVTGAYAGEVSQAVEDLPVQIVHNPEWKTGQGSSVRAGTLRLNDHVESACYLLADMPAVSIELLQTLQQKHRATMASVIAPSYGGRQGNPVLFDRRVFPELRELSGEHGGKQLFGRHDVLHVEWDESIHLDIDTRQDYLRLHDG